MLLSQLLHKVLNFYQKNHKNNDNSMIKTKIDDIWIYVCHQNQQNIYQLQKAGFVLILQNQKVIQTHHQTQICNAGQYACYSLEVPIVSDYYATLEEPYVDIRMYLDLDLMRQVIDELERNNFKFSSNHQNIADVTDSLLQAFILLVDILDNPQEQVVLIPLIKKMIYYYLLTGEQGAILYDIANKNSQAYKISQAVSWIKDNYNQHFDIHQLASTYNMSSSGFYAHFRQLLGISPLQYQKQIRLLEARRLIRTRAFTVSQVAYEVGYESLSQFSREYKRQFGIAPSEQNSV